MEKPHTLFDVWSPDQVAECLDGVSEDIYRELWAIVPEYDDKPRSEWNDDFSDRCLTRFWDKLTPDAQAKLNVLADASGL